MKLFIDTEFNGFGGELISMAIVAEDGREWYGILPVADKLVEWVEEHVRPVLDIEGFSNSRLTVSAFQASLARFLTNYNGAEFIADWPSDLEHLCHMMTYAGMKAGYRIPIECTMRLIHGGNTKPLIPHNALSDARALRDWYMKEHK